MNRYDLLNARSFAPGCRLFGLLDCIRTFRFVWNRLERFEAGLIIRMADRVRHCRVNSHFAIARNAKRLHRDWLLARISQRESR